MLNDKETKAQIPEFSEERNIFGRWASFFINRYRVVYLIILAIIIIGIGSYFALPRELNPEIILPYGRVMTFYNGVAPEEIESLITDKIETALEGIEGVKTMNSHSGLGYSSVWLEFEQGVIVEDKIEEMRKEISKIQRELPADAESPMIESLESNNAPIMIVNVYGDYDLVTLKKMAEKIERRMEQEGNVSQVKLTGGLEKEINIIVDPQYLSQYGISVDAIKNAVSLSNLDYPGGTATMDQKNYNIRTVGKLSDVEQLKKVVIAYNGNTPLYLGDIATIENGYKEVESFSRISMDMDTDHPIMQKSITLAVYKKQSADLLSTSEKVREILNDGKGNLYPEDLHIYVSGDTSEIVSEQLGDVGSNAISGLLLVLIVLFIFIGFKEAVVVSMVIPLALLSTMFGLRVMDMTINTITLFSMVLAVGMLVDNGIVIMENIDRLRMKGLTAKEASEIGTNQIAPAVGSSMLTTLAAFFPLLLTSGIMGAFIKGIPITVIIALASSFVIAITITPSLCAVILKDRSGHGLKQRNPKIEFGKKILVVAFVMVLSLFAFKEGDSFGMLSYFFAFFFGAIMYAKEFVSKGKHDIKDSKFLKAFGEWVHGIVKKRSKRWFFVISLLVAFTLCISTFAVGLLKVEMFSNEDQERLYVQVKTPTGTTLERTSEITGEVEKILFTYPEVNYIVTSVGEVGADSYDSFSASSATNPTLAVLRIDLVKAEERDRTSIEVAKALREEVRSIAGAEVEIQELSSGPPTGNGFSVNLLGENLDELNRTGDQLVEILKEIKGVREPERSGEQGAYELQVIIDKEKASMLGLDDLTIAMGIRNAVDGLVATKYRHNQDETDVVIKTASDKLMKKSDLESLYFYSRSGAAIMFSEVAKIVENRGITGISHLDGKREITVSSAIDEGYLAVDITKEFQDRVAKLHLPDTVTLDYGGEFGAMNDSFGEMFVNMIIAVILVFIILAIQFNSLSQPFIILMSVPMALIGVIPGLILTGNNFGFLAFLGVVALVGIAVNDAIVLVDYINYLRKSGYDLYDAVKETCITRFNPVMATTITTAGGILPLTLKQPFYSQMGYALIFGLMMATILTLVLVPVLYTMLEETKLKSQEKKAAKMAKQLEQFAAEEVSA